MAWRALAQRLGVSDLTARVLAARGMLDPEEARNFLSPTLDSLHDPFLFADMERAVERIRQAVAHRERVLIYGDYDVDGITSCALLYSFLRFLGVQVSTYIPNRLTEGYGVGLKQIKKAQEDGCSLVITVDCGITSEAEVAWAREHGVDVIITDHHNPGERLPAANAIINPKVSGCGYPFSELAGVGVAFKLAWALGERMSRERRLGGEFERHILNGMALVAMGTVADVVPLVNENRTLVRFGLRALEATRNTGLRALLETTGLDKTRLGARHISFRLAPRINAAGRIGRAEVPLRLLCASETVEAYELARQLEADNRMRQKIEAEILSSVRAMLEKNALDEPLLILDGSWHTGVTGIVASRLTNELNRPVVLIVTDGETGKGTARSIEGCDIYELLRECREFLRDFGGHSFAAGFEIRTEHIEAFRRRLIEVAHQRIGRDAPERNIEIDALVDFGDLSVTAVEELDRLEPFGEGNRRPLLATREVVIQGAPRRYGRGGKKLLFFARQGPLPVKAVMTGGADVEEALASLSDQTCEIAYTPRIQRRAAVATVELEVHDVRRNGRSIVPDARPR